MRDVSDRLTMTAIILAGGRSRRIGVNKAFLTIGGTPVIDIIMGSLRPLFTDILIVTKSPRDYRRTGARVVADVRPESGSLVGLHAGLSHSGDNHNFVIACDMPLLKPVLIEYMRSLAPDYDVVVPMPHGNYEPLFAFYSRNCIPHIEDLLGKGNFRIFDFFPRVEVRRVGDGEIARCDPAGFSFLNMNTEEDHRNLEGVWNSLHAPSRASLGGQNA